MTDVPKWHLTGEWFDVCSCNLPCPCEFAQPATNNYCQGILAWHIREGRCGEVEVDGLNVLAVSDFHGNIWSGTTRAALGAFFDERADDRQRDALQMIFSGKAGGWPAGFADLIGEDRGVEFAPVSIEIASDLAHWRAEVPERVTAEAEALTGPTTPPGKRVQLINPPGSEVGPGGVATWGKGITMRAKAMGYEFDITDCSSKYIPFEWAGPGEAVA